MHILLGENIIASVFLTSDAVVVEGQTEDSESTAAAEGEESDTLDEEGAASEDTASEDGTSESPASEDGTENSLPEEETSVSPEDGQTDTGSENEYYVPESDGGTDTYSDSDMTGADSETLEGTQATGKDPLLSNGLFVGGISAAVFLIGGVLGALLARKKIKKGIDPYEDF